MRQYLYTIAVLILLTPLGLLATGTAWGEWGLEDMPEVVGFVPHGMLNFPIAWEAIFPDYTLPFVGESLAEQAPIYMLAAVVGVVLIYGIFWGLQRMVLPSGK